MNSRTLLFFLIFSAFFIFISPLTFSEELLSQEQSEGFPKHWTTFPFHKAKAKKVYQMKSEGQTPFIHAYDDQDISVPIFRETNWSLVEHPLFRWKWRALILPQGASENSRKTHDSACSVYVSFGKWGGRILKYVWSSSLPTGYVWEKEAGKFYVIVKSSGAGQLNQWQSQEVNVLEDYEKYFKEKPSGNPTGIGILTDGNATHTPSSCDYQGFGF